MFKCISFLAGSVSVGLFSSPVAGLMLSGHVAKKQVCHLTTATTSGDARDDGSAENVCPRKKSWKERLTRGNKVAVAPRGNQELDEDERKRREGESVIMNTIGSGNLDGADPAHITVNAGGRNALQHNEWTRPSSAPEARKTQKQRPPTPEDRTRTQTFILGSVTARKPQQEVAEGLQKVRPASAPTPLQSNTVCPLDAEAPVRGHDQCRREHRARIKDCQDEEKAKESLCTRTTKLFKRKSKLRE